MSGLVVSPHFLLKLGPRGELLIYHVRARTMTEVSASVLSLLKIIAEAEGEGTAELARDALSHEGELRLRSVTREGTLDGLFADPTNLDLAALETPLSETASVTFEEAVDALEDKLLLYRDPTDYEKRFELKRQESDPQRQGNFYQHLTEQLSGSDADPEAWWVDQKFEDGGVRLRHTLYEQVQHNYLQQAFPPGSLAGKQILDFGCGPGFYSAFFADRGGEVLGLDPSVEHLRRARRRFSSPTCRFRQLRLRGGRILPFVSGRYDVIWISDTLLFYFTLPHLVPIRARLLERLRGLLRDGGDLVVMDPHGLFWLTPWFGDDEHPFTVVSEYGPSDVDRQFRVTPSLGELSRALTDAGFVIRRIDEPGPNDEALEGDPKGYHFARKFPLWWVVWATGAQPRF